MLKFIPQGCSLKILPDGFSCGEILISRAYQTKRGKDRKD
jgi:hypothetical protein